MTKLREITIQFPEDADHCKLIAKQLQAAGFNEMARQLLLSVGQGPAVDEPVAFGSIIRATTKGLRCKWQRSPLNGTHYWQSEFGDVEVWSELTDVEVLRVGLGDKCNCPKATSLGYGIELQPSCPQHGPDVIRVMKQDAKDAYDRGGADMNAAIHQKLRALLAEAITGERKNAFEKAIQAVEELAP